MSGIMRVFDALLARYIIGCTFPWPFPHLPQDVATRVVRYHWVYR